MDDGFNGRIRGEMGGWLGAVMGRGVGARFDRRVGGWCEKRRMEEYVVGEIEG